MTPQRRKNTYKLSPTQEGIIFHDPTAQHSEIDIEQIVCSIDEPIEVDTLKLAWRQIVDRHEALRTAFHAHKDEEPYQQVHRDVVVPWNSKDLRALTVAQQESELNRWLRQDRETSFELERAPLLRLNLFRLGDKKWTLVWTFHRGILDSRSLSVVLTEVFRTYDAALRGEALDLPAVRPYSDYTEFLYTLDHSQAEKYWRKTLRDFDGTTALARLEGGGREVGYAEEEIQLSPTVTQALGDLAIRERFTVNNAVQAAWALALSRYNNTADVVFGAARPCRGFLPRAGSMVGKFSNTLPVRVKIVGASSVFELLRQVRATEIATRDYEHTPLARIQSWSDLPPANPLFESAIVFDHAPLNAQMRSPYLDWTNRQVRLREQSSCPVTLYAYAEPALALRFAYDRSRFGQANIQEVLGHLHTILGEIAKGIDQDAGDLQKLIPQERRLPAVIRNEVKPLHSDRIQGRVAEQVRISPVSAPIPQIQMTPVPMAAVTAPVIPAMFAPLPIVLAPVAPTKTAQAPAATATPVSPVQVASTPAAPAMLAPARVAPAVVASVLIVPPQVAPFPVAAVTVAPVAITATPVLPVALASVLVIAAINAPSAVAPVLQDKAVKPTDNPPADQDLWNFLGEKPQTASVPSPPVLIESVSLKPSLVERGRSSEPFAWATEPAEDEKDAARTRESKKRLAPGSVLRDLLKGAKDAASTAVSVKTYLAAPAALRAFLTHDSSPQQAADTVQSTLTLRDSVLRGQSPLMAIQPNGAKQPIFCIGALDGDLALFRTLSAGLGNNQPVYALDPSGLKNDPSTRTDVKKIARYFIDQLRSAGQDRPYCLMGHSFGGLVALEMSQQLRASGAEVPATVLIDTHYPAGCRTNEKISARVHRYTSHLQKALKRNSAGSSDRNHSETSLSMSGLAESSQTIEMPKIEQNAADRYRARPYPGRACILKASTPLPVFDGGPKAGWDRIFSDNISIYYEIPGDRGIINTNKHSGLMVRRLNEFLGGVEEARVVPVFSRIAS